MARIRSFSIKTTSNAYLVYLSTTIRIPGSTKAFSTFQLGPTIDFGRTIPQFHLARTPQPHTFLQHVPNSNSSFRWYQQQQRERFFIDTATRVSMTVPSQRRSKGMSEAMGENNDNDNDNKGLEKRCINDLTYRELQALCKKRGLGGKGTTASLRSKLLNDEMSGLSIEGSVPHKPSTTPMPVPVSPPPVRSSSPTRTKWNLSTPPKSTGKRPSTTTTTSTSTATTQPSSSSTSTTSSSRKRPRITPGSLPPPKNWSSTYTLVEELRSDRTAPLDSDGAEALTQRNLGPRVYRFQVLVALMLSSQTKDATVGEAMRALQEHGLTVENIQKTDAKVLNALIRKVGFHNNKTRYMKQMADVLAMEYGGDIPETAEDIMKLVGVGPKMAYIVEQIAFDRSTGIGVDTHMHRIFNNLKWVNSTTPERTREQLEGWLPREKWSGVNMLWVGFGQETQQQKEKIIRKALGCSRPVEALGLLKRVGVDLKKEGKRYGLEEEIRNAFADGR